MRTEAAFKTARAAADPDPHPVFADAAGADSAAGTALALHASAHR